MGKPRVVMVTIRMSERERAKIHKAASAHGLSVNQYARWMIGLDTLEELREQNERIKQPQGT